MDLTQDSLPYITGMGYRKECDFIFDEFEKFDISSISQFENMKIFVKTDLLPEFAHYILPNITEKFVLFTHNSDINIDHSHSYIFNNDYVSEWYGQNVNIVHSKIKSIPIGLANRRWNHGNVDIFDKVINMKCEKTNMVYCNFDVNTNLTERVKCLESIYPLRNSEKKTFEEYLIELSSSYFVISPNGNGIDCHKHWEALYFKTIPIVTKSINISFYKDYPILVIDSWEDFKNLNLNIDLYNKIISESKCTI